MIRIPVSSPASVPTIPSTSILSSAEQAAEAGHGADHHNILGHIHRDDPLLEDIAQAGIGGGSGLSVGLGVAVAPGAGELLHQPKLLDVPGNGGLSGDKSSGFQLFQKLLLGFHVLGLHNFDDFILPRVFPGATPPNFWLITW